MFPLQALDNFDTFQGVASLDLNHGTDLRMGVMKGSSIEKADAPFP